MAVKAKTQTRSSGRTTNLRSDSRTKIVRNRPHAMDYSIVFLVLFLVGFGLVMIYSTSSYKGSLYFNDAAYWLKRQALFAGVGVCAMFFVAKLDYHIWKK